MKPLPFLLFEMSHDQFARSWSTEMNVGGFPPHGVQKTEFSIGSTQRSQLNAGAVRCEAANDPASPKLDERIGTANGTIDDGLVKNLGWAFVMLGPEG